MHLSVDVQIGQGCGRNESDAVGMQRLCIPYVYIHKYLLAWTGIGWNTSISLDDSTRLNSCGHIRAYTSVRNICYFLLSLLLVVVLFYLPTYAYRQDIMDLIIRYHNLLPCSRLMYSSFIDENNKNVLSHNVKPAHGILLLKGPKNKKNSRQKK